MTRNGVYHVRINGSIHEVCASSPARAAARALQMLKGAEAQADGYVITDIRKVA